jgi:CBS domain-containing protein
VNTEVDVISLSSSMKEALDMLLIHPGIPVVNDEGPLPLALFPLHSSTTGIIVTTLSASDLRGVENSSVALFQSQTVQEFLFILYNLEGGGGYREPLMVTVNTPIKEAAKFMYRHHIHRLWVSASELTPRGGVVTYTDIIRAVHSLEMR